MNPKVSGQTGGAWTRLGLNLVKPGTLFVETKMNVMWKRRKEKLPVDVDPPPEKTAHEELHQGEREATAETKVSQDVTPETRADGGLTAKTENTNQGVYS